MLSGFFYALRGEGLPVSLYEWLTLMEALSRGLADNSLTEFYYLARSLLIKNEALYDKYDGAFEKYFGGDEAEKKILTAPKAAERSYDPDFFNPARYEAGHKPASGAETETSAFPDRLDVSAAPQSAESEEGGREAEEQAGGGSKSGDGEFGSGDVNFGGDTRGMTAVKVAGQRRYRDYQDDNIKNIRQYEIALRYLRQLSTKLEGPKDELELGATVEETGRNGGLLSLQWERPRRNALKVLVLMDSMGSIYSHYDVCKKLFNAANRSTHFKEIRFYYFHNCVYGRIYKTQWLDVRESVATEDFFRLYNADYRLLIVGDAQMGEQELMKAGGVIDWSAEYNAEPGLTWLKRIARRYPYAAWLNPVPEQYWGGYESIEAIGEVFAMYELTPGGIGKAVKKLLSRSG